MEVHLLNFFSLHRKYFRDDANRLTANLLFLLSELRSSQELMDVLNTIMFSGILTLPEYQYSFIEITIRK